MKNYHYQESVDVLVDTYLDGSLAMGTHPEPITLSAMDTPNICFAIDNFGNFSNRMRRHDHPWWMLVS